MWRGREDGVYGRWRGSLTGWLLAVGMVCGDAAAQATYTVFPARAPVANRAQQPVKGGAGTLVTLVVRDSAIDYLVKELVRQAHLKPLYYNSAVLSKRITVRIADMKVMDALGMVLSHTGLEAKLLSDGETVAIVPQSGKGPAARAQTAGGIVVGHVTDSASGQGLGGVQVRVEGVKELSAVTSDSGNFTLRDVPAGDQVISVRLFGYRPAERTVTVVDGQRTTVRIVIVAVPTVLSGVVTTATGLQSRLSVGNDITTLNVDSVMKVAPVTSVTDLLETRVPGLTVLHSSGTPGDPSRIRIRGASSINGNNDPIVVVDGIRMYASQSDSRNNNLAPSLSGGSAANSIGGNNRSYAAPSPLDQIDPNSIETIEVFKGPSASALYGSDAANGVIVITTKRGRAGPTHWQLALGAGFVSPPGDWPVNYYRFGSSLSDFNTTFCVWNDITCKTDSVVAYQALNDSRYSVFADHGSDQTASLTVSGGVPTMNYSLTVSSANTLGYLKLPGLEQQRYEQYYLKSAPHWMVRPDAYTNFGGSGQLTVQPNSKTRVTLTSSLYNGVQQRSSLEQAVTQLEGKYIDPLFLGTSSLINNEMERATDNQISSTNALTMQLQPVSWLPITATGGLNTIQRVDKAYIPFGVNSVSIGNFLLDPDTNGNYGLGRGTSVDKTLDLNTTIPLRGITLSAGGNYHSGSVADFQAQTNALAPGVQDPTDFSIAFCNTGFSGEIGNGCSSFSQSSSSSATYGWFFEPRFNFGSRFFAAPGFRLDGGSASGTHGGFNGSGLTGLPKIDLSYVAVDRPTHPLFGVLSLLRPRIAFGVAGTQPSPGDKLRLFNINQQNESVITLDGTVVPSTFLDALGNTQLQPETSRELEGGFEASLWNRLSLTVSQYNKTRHNAIISIPVAPSVSGGGSVQFNIGEVRNTGTELTLNAQVFQSRAFGWTVGGNISNDNNLLVHLNPGALNFIGNGNGANNYGVAVRNVPGYPLFSQWALPVVSYADANGDGVIERSEIRFGDSLVYVGQQAPKYQMNINTGVSLLSGRLSVYATFAYQNGLTQNNAAAFSSGALNFLGNTPGTTLATQAAIVAASSLGSGLDGLAGSNVSQIGLLQTVNTFRFQSLSINYTIPRSVASLFRAPRMSVALQGSNLGLHTNYRGIDPNVNAFPSGNNTQDSGQLPQPRTWRLMFNLGN